MRRILLLTGVLLMAPVADAQTLSVMWDPPSSSALFPPHGFNVYRNHLKILTESPTTTRAPLPPPYLVGDVIEVSAFRIENNNVFESALVPTCFPSLDGLQSPPAAFILDSGCHLWTIEAGTSHILRDQVWTAGGLGQRLLWLTGVIYALGLDSNWYSFGDATGWVNIGTTPPGGTTPIPPPISDSTPPAITRLDVIPRQNASVRVHVEAADNVAVTRIDIRVNNVLRRTCTGSALLTCDYSSPTRTLVAGTNTVTVTASDAVGLTAAASKTVIR